MHDYTHYLNDCKFILVSNREPYEHIKAPSGNIEVKQPAGGLVTALDPTMRRTHGTWVAWGSGSGDRETSDEAGRLQVPPGENVYSLRRVWLDEADVNGYYHGFANRALWPLCHMLIQHFEFRTEFWERYRAVNLRFAHAVADEAERCSGRSMAWIQDYHFGLAAEFLRAMRPSLFIHQFWHIPFPPPDILRLLPSGTHEALLRGLLGNDLMEFQIDRYAQNFLECVDQFFYTKAIPERLRALATLWEELPELREQFTFIFVCTPSRTDLKAYHMLEQEVVQQTMEINQRFGNPDWTPIVLINENVDS